MRKRITLVAALALVCGLSLVGCGSKVRDEATAAVEAYNTAVESYNENIAPYNEAVNKIVDANAELSDVMNGAQEAKVSEPELIDEFEILSITDDMKSADLKAITEKANTDVETVNAASVPDVSGIPDYSKEIAAVQETQTAYEDSIQGMKQVMAPSDEFVMERLQRVDTITMMGAVTEDHDPNGKLVLPVWMEQCLCRVLIMLWEQY